MPHQYGPFPIIKKVGKSAYHLQLPPTWKIHPIFNESYLTPYNPPAFPIQKSPPPPPPEIVDGLEQYEVKEILDSQFHQNQLQYLVKWKRYPSEENTWELERNLKKAPTKSQTSIMLILLPHDAFLHPSVSSHYLLLSLLTICLLIGG